MFATRHCSIPISRNFNAATERRFKSLTELINHMTFCTEQLTENTGRVRGHLDTDLAKSHGPSASLFCTRRSHTNIEKVSPIELNLLLDYRPEGGSVKKFSLRERSRRTELLRPIFGIRVARQFTEDVDCFFSHADRARQRRSTQ